MFNPGGLCARYIPKQRMNHLFTRWVSAAYASIMTATNGQ
jgi:hypothetical protein